MSKDLGEPQLAAWRTFITLHATVVELIDRTLVAEGQLPLHWYDVLIELAEAPQRRLRLHELARSVVLSRSGLTRLVDRIEAAGLLRREPDPADRRGSFAVLTAEGQAALRATWPVYAGAIQKHFAQHLSDDEVRIITEAFGRALAAERHK